MRSWSNNVFFHAFWWNPFAFVVLISDEVERWLGFFCCGFGFISDILCPSISWSGLWTWTLDTEIVDTSDQSEVSSFTPIASPWVSNNPIFSSVFYTPSSNGDIMVKTFASCIVNEDSTGVIEKFRRDSDNTTDWTSLEYFIDDVCFTINKSIFFNTINFCSFLGPTSFLWETISALDLCWTTYSIFMAISLIWWASLVSDVVLMNPSIGSSGISTIATMICRFARNQHLRTQVDIWPLGFSSDLDSVTQCACGWECPAWPTVYGDVLVSLISQVIGAIDISPPIVGWEISHI